MSSTDRTRSLCCKLNERRFFFITKIRQAVKDFFPRRKKALSCWNDLDRLYFLGKPWVSSWIIVSKLSCSVRPSERWKRDPEGLKGACDLPPLQVWSHRNVCQLWKEMVALELLSLQKSLNLEPQWGVILAQLCQDTWVPFSFQIKYGSQLGCLSFWDITRKTFNLLIFNSDEVSFVCNRFSGSKTNMLLILGGKQGDKSSIWELGGVSALGSNTCVQRESPRSHLNQNMWPPAPKALLHQWGGNLGWSAPSLALGEIKLGLMQTWASLNLLFLLLWSHTDETQILPPWAGNFPFLLLSPSFPLLDTD